MNNFISSSYKKFSQEFRFSFFQLILIFIIVFVSGILQSTDVLNIVGIKPNLSLTILITLSFFVTEALHYLFLIVIAGGLMRFQPGDETATVVFALLALIAFFISDKLPGRVTLNNIFLIALATVFFHIMTDFSFISSDIFSVALEMVYNITLGTAFLYLFKKLFKHGKI